MAIHTKRYSPIFMCRNINILGIHTNKKDTKIYKINNFNSNSNNFFHNPNYRNNSNTK